MALPLVLLQVLQWTTQCDPNADNRGDINGLNVCAREFVPNRQKIGQ